MIRLGLLSGVFAALAAHAQLIPAGSPVPQTTLPPVVFINGYQFEGCPSTFAGTFGIADQVLQANGEVSLFFSTCSLPSSATIEDLAASFGTFLAGLKYTDGSPVETVDVVAHSMGGLVLRSYLSGKQDTAGMFQPPAATHVRKAIFLATPNFGTPIASLVPLIAVQVEEMSSGSAFVFDLGTWNDATDDLRGVDAIAAVGNAGTGLLTGTAGFDDGVVPLTSGSLRFYGPGRTRVVPYCHIDGGGISTLFNVSGGCKGDRGHRLGDARFGADDCFLPEWNKCLAKRWNGRGERSVSFGGRRIDRSGARGRRYEPDHQFSVRHCLTTDTKLGISSDGLAFTTWSPPVHHAAECNVRLDADYGNTLTLPAGGTEPYLVKPGPLIARVFPAAARQLPA